MTWRKALVAVALVATTLVQPPHQAVADDGLLTLVGSVHEHSSYSDGGYDKTPATYYASAKHYGLDFLGSGEHSDSTNIPLALSDGCLSADIIHCPGPIGPEALDKWGATLDQANAASTSTFTGFRGFEWSSDRFGHIDVYFSKNVENAKTDGGYATMSTFYKWLQTAPNLGGGADGVGTFNHPGSKKLRDEPAVNWNDFTYDPSVDYNMAGIEVYNDMQEYGTTRDVAKVKEGYYVHALDKGWHVGPVGAEDLHGIPGSDDYGAPRWAKTVILAKDRSTAGLRAAMLARHFYAIRRNDGLRLSFAADDQMMGSRLVRTSGNSVHLAATSNRPGSTLEIVTSKGRVVATGTDAIDTQVRWTPLDKYYFVRVKNNGEFIGYTAPVWITAAKQTPVGQWLAGDLHVHTCYSHDAYCPPDDDNTGVDQAYTLSGSVQERFLEASLRGLDYLAITDHNDVRSESAPGFGSLGVVGVPGYENSIHGHAQMLGATRVYNNGSASPAEMNAIADDLRARGGLFQANHPSDGITYKLDKACAHTQGLGWQYPFSVPVESVEVWNISQSLQPPLPSMTSNEDSVTYWECWLNRGAHVAATGGSDSHWLDTSVIQGPGNPTTWVFAKDRSAQGVLDAIKAGRTSVSFTAPLTGSPRLILEADTNRDGVYESMVGDTVPPGTKMRVRAEGLLGLGQVDVRANGVTFIEGRALLPGGEITFLAPNKPGWIRAQIHENDLRTQRQNVCEPYLGKRTTYCRNNILLLAMTSAIYLG